MILQSLQNKPRPADETRRRNRDWLVLIASILVGGLIIAVPHAAVHFSRWQFENRVKIGMSLDETRTAAGEPTFALEEGQVLDRWGSSAARKVAGTVWIYPLFPGSSNRAVVTFKDGRISQIEFQFT